MNDIKDIDGFRVKLYNSIWDNPIDVVSKNHGLSIAALRKRCKSLNIPVPGAGYWKNPESERILLKPLLPSYHEIVLFYYPKINHLKSTQIRKGFIEVHDLNKLSIDELHEMEGFDLLDPTSLETLKGWSHSIIVPAKDYDFHELIIKHKAEIEYRMARDLEYPFHDSISNIHIPKKTLVYRNNKAVLPIDVSSKQQSRAYRIIDTLINALNILKANVRVDDIEMDNVSINLFRTGVSFSLCEQKIKLRHSAVNKAKQEFRPSYEMTYCGIIEIEWQLHSEKSHWRNAKTDPTILTYIDSSESRIENLIPQMILDIFKQCCTNLIMNHIEERQLQIERELQDIEAQKRMEILKRQSYEAKLISQKNELIKKIKVEANQWFEYEKLLKYANELESLDTCSLDEESKLLLVKYIRLTRELAKEASPLHQILNTIQTLESDNDD